MSGKAEPLGWMIHARTKAEWHWPSDRSRPDKNDKLNREADRDTWLVGSNDRGPYEFEPEGSDEELEPVYAEYHVSLDASRTVWTLWLSRDAGDDENWKTSRIAACIWPGASLGVVATWMIDKYFQARRAAGLAPFPRYFDPALEIKSGLGSVVPLRELEEKYWDIDEPEHEEDHEEDWLDMDFDDMEENEDESN